MLLVITGLVLLLILGLWVLVLPVHFRLDSTQQRIEIQQWGTFRLWIDPQHQPGIRVLGFRVPVNTKSASTEVQPKAPAKRKPKTGKPFRPTLRAIRQGLKEVVHCFRLRNLELDVDFDDVVLYAQCYPLAAWMSRGPVRVSVNQEGRVLFRVHLTVVPARLAGVFLRFYIKNK